MKTPPLDNVIAAKFKSSDTEIARQSQNFASTKAPGVPAASLPDLLKSSEPVTRRRSRKRFVSTPDSQVSVVASFVEIDDYVSSSPQTAPPPGPSAPMTTVGQKPTCPPAAPH